MKKGLLFFTIVFLMAAGTAVSDWTIYDCNVLPENATPAWAKSDVTAGVSDGPTSALITLVNDPIVAGNKLIRLDELAGDKRESILNASGLLKSTTGFTCVLRAKASPGSSAFSGAVTDDQRYCYVSVRDGTFEETLILKYPHTILLDRSAVSADFPDYASWHIFRITLKNGTVNVYLDENSTPILSGVTIRATSNNYFKIGDQSTGGRFAGDCDWIIWDISGAYAPGQGTALPKSLTGLTSVETMGSLAPERFTIYQNYPNPFNPFTWIQFDLAVPDRVKLCVYDIGSKLVNTLVDQNLSAGSHRAWWDGKDTRGNSVSAGIYVYVLETGNTKVMKKMSLVK